MSGLPETIKAWTWNDKTYAGQWHVRGQGETTEYRRADLTPNDEECLRNEKVRALVGFTKDMAIRALSGDHSREELCAILSHEDALFQRDCDIVRARAALTAMQKVKE